MMKKKRLMMALVLMQESEEQKQRWLVVGEIYELLYWVRRLRDDSGIHPSAPIKYKKRWYERMRACQTLLWKDKSPV